MHVNNRLLQLFPNVLKGSAVQRGRLCGHTPAEWRALLSETARLHAAPRGRRRPAQPLSRDERRKMRLAMLSLETLKIRRERQKAAQPYNRFYRVPL